MIGFPEEINLRECKDTNYYNSRGLPGKFENMIEVVHHTPENIGS